MKLILLLSLLIVSGCSSSVNSPVEPERLKNIRLSSESAECVNYDEFGQYGDTYGRECHPYGKFRPIPMGLIYVGLQGDNFYVSNIERIEGNPDTIVFDTWYVDLLTNPSEPEWILTRKGEASSVKFLCDSEGVEVYMDIGGVQQLRSSSQSYEEFSKEFEDIYSTEELQEFYKLMVKGEYVIDEGIGEWMCSNY